MLKKSLENYKKKEEELTNALKKEVLKEIESMNLTDFKSFKAMFGFMKASTALIEEQTKVLDKMNEKLDKLLGERV